MDLDLLEAAKSGDEEALRQLFRQYRPLVYSIRNKYSLRDFDDQDWLQEGMITFHECIQSFKPDLGTTLGTLFKRSFENHICSLIRKEYAYKRKSNQQTIVIDSRMLQDNVELLAKDNPLEQLIIQEILDEWQISLTPLEKEAFILYGLSPSSQSGTSDRAMQSAYDRSRRKMRRSIQHLQEDNFG